MNKEGFLLWPCCEFRNSPCETQCTPCSKIIREFFNYFAKCSRCEIFNSWQNLIIGPIAFFYVICFILPIIFCIYLMFAFLAIFLVCYVTPLAVLNLALPCYKSEILKFSLSLKRILSKEQILSLKVM
jgi:hypothetical protein